MNTSRLNKAYYYCKPLIPRAFQIWMRSKVVLHKRSLCSNKWPIDENAAKLPDEWPGWPDKKNFALILTHDVDTDRGQQKCRQLMEIEKQLGFKSSFNFVPERYAVSAELRNFLTSQGFEVGVHGLNHDGKLFQSQKIFKERSPKINHYIEEWQACGFRSPAMHHNLDWLHDLNVEYDASTFDTDPFEPQSDGVGTIFPFWVEKSSDGMGYVELPYTLPQDFTVFILMKEKNIDIWKKKTDWIAEKGGMILLNSHPDYMTFNGEKPRLGEYPVELYQALMNYIKNNYEGRYWHVLPYEAARYYKSIQQPQIF
jgi:hypothetical protein